MLTKETVHIFTSRTLQLGLLLGLLFSLGFAVLEAWMSCLGCLFFAALSLKLLLMRRFLHYVHSSQVLILLMTYWWLCSAWVVAFTGGLSSPILVWNMVTPTLLETAYHFLDDGSGNEQCVRRVVYGLATAVCLFLATLVGLSVTLMDPPTEVDGNQMIVFTGLSYLVFALFMTAWTKISANTHEMLRSQDLHIQECNALVTQAQRREDILKKYLSMIAYCRPFPRPYKKLLLLELDRTIGEQALSSQPLQQHQQQQQQQLHQQFVPELEEAEASRNAAVSQTVFSQEDLKASEEYDPDAEDERGPGSTAHNIDKDLAHALLDHPVSLEFFKDYAGQAHCSELVFFYLDAKVHLQQGKKARHNLAKLIGETYIRQGAPSEINISAKLREETLHKIHEKARHPFSHAVKEILELLATGPLRAWKESDSASLHFCLQLLTQAQAIKLRLDFVADAQEANKRSSMKDTSSAAPIAKTAASGLSETGPSVSAGPRHSAIPTPGVGASPGDVSSLSSNFAEPLDLPSLSVIAHREVSQSVSATTSTSVPSNNKHNLDYLTAAIAKGVDVDQSLVISQTEEVEPSITRNSGSEEAWTPRGSKNGRRMEPADVPLDV
eukprot:gb/GEZN01004504.1/.p1 GENE.gb/GEZN01004504.1/~~gb/GEZN01004504.1/.p1  ORF type:complete len:624 (+),score=81.07 gb/GEZN01004504.1/:44-1873(+)